MRSPPRVVQHVHSPTQHTCSMQHQCTCHHRKHEVCWCESTREIFRYQIMPCSSAHSVRLTQAAGRSPSCQHGFRRCSFLHNRSRKAGMQQAKAGTGLEKTDEGLRQQLSKDHGSMVAVVVRLAIEPHCCQRIETIWASTGRYRQGWLPCCAARQGCTSSNSSIA
jgi:hypothetical protein